jgi:hypothetical protein
LFGERTGRKDRGDDNDIALRQSVEKWQAGIQRLKSLKISVSRTLTIIMEVMGINIFTRSDSMRISPGSLPNQLSSHGANCHIAPAISNSAPVIIIHLAMAAPYNNHRAGRP